MFDSKLAHCNGSLHHDPRNEAFLHSLYGVRKIIKRKYFHSILLVAKFLCCHNFGNRGTTHLAYAKNTLEIWMSTENGFVHRYCFREIIFGPFGCNDLNVRIFGERLFNAINALIEV